MSENLSFWAWLLLAYFLGSLPWSVWLGKLICGIDVRSYGDRNPGTANAFRGGGKLLGLSVLLLDFLKAFLPVFFVNWGAGYNGWPLYLIALAPTVGHAYSIFLRGRGGRALVTLFGVWSGLTFFTIPIVMGGCAALVLITYKRDEVASAATLVGATAFMIVQQYEPYLIVLALTQLILLTVKISPANFRAHSSSEIIANPQTPPP